MGEDAAETEPVSVGGALGLLPDIVRARVVAMASEAIGRVPTENLPASLKRVASFAPSRRGKLAGSRIVSVLETDETFREHLAAQVRLEVPELAKALEAGSAPPAVDPVELAAVAYLLRPAGWSAVVAGAVDLAGVEHAAEAHKVLLDQVHRLQKQVGEAAEELRTARQRSRDQVAALKAENSDLRQKLGEARSRVKAAEAVSESAKLGAKAATVSASAGVSAAEAESRRLRSRIEELEGDLTKARRTERTQRGGEALRARLLLDTLLESAQGLRRELALPAVEAAPADAVEAHVAEQGSRTSSSHGSMSSDDPALLDQLLSLPRAHMIVDGYNVTKGAWPGSSLELQRDRLLVGLASLVARSGAETTVIFDAADKSERPPVNRPRGVRVLFSPFGVIADDVIRDLVAAEPQGRPVVVVSSDREVVRDVVRAGARAVESPALSRLLARS